MVHKRISKFLTCFMTDLQFAKRDTAHMAVNLPYKPSPPHHIICTKEDIRRLAESNIGTDTQHGYAAIT